jgi:hypothetical protein
MEQSTSWRLLVYRLPAQPSSARVAVWRELRRLGALPLQQSCVALPALAPLDVRLREIGERIATEGGEHFLFELTNLSAADELRLRAAWNALRSQEYAEIVEECRTKFVREIEFEIFRDNLTGAEAEELEADLDKIRSWFDRIRNRDWFEASGRTEVESEIAICAGLLDDFTERVYHREADEGPSLEPPIDLPWGEGDGDGQPGIVSLRRRRGRSAGGGGTA